MGLLLVYIYINNDNVCGVPRKNLTDINSLVASKEEVKGYFDVLKFEDKPIPYDSADNTLYVYQDLNSTQWQGSITAEVGDIYFLDNKDFDNKSQYISKNQHSKLYLVGTDSYEIFDVCFSGMPLINICEERDYVEIFYSDKSKIIAKEMVGNIQVRGGRSKGYEKSSFKLTLKEKQSLLNMRCDDDWILNALYDDLGLIHNALSYEMWNQISKDNNVKFDNTVNMEFVELLVNGEYRGVYGLTERIDAKFFGGGVRKC